MLVIKKFGGSSVSSIENIEVVADKIYKDRNKRLVIIVSAMGTYTDELLQYANMINDEPSGYELDRLLSSGEQISSSLLSMALQKRGVKAISLGAYNIGLLTDSNHTEAKILSINCSNIEKLLSDGNVVVISGFQGIDKNNNITTLGRGGSDLTAISLACALEAKSCEIYTDVDGVYTIDPKIEPKSSKIDIISYDEMLELSSSGAKILQDRCVEVAREHGLDIVVRSTFSDNIGTLVTKEDQVLEKPLIRGIVLNKTSMISIKGLKDTSKNMSDVLNLIRSSNINLDFIVQTKTQDGLASIDFTLDSKNYNKTIDILKNNINYTNLVTGSKSLAKISIIGKGVKANASIISKISDVLDRENINLKLITSSDMRVSIIIDKKFGEHLAKILHSYKDLGELD